MYNILIQILFKLLSVIRLHIFYPPYLHKMVMPSAGSAGHCKCCVYLLLTDSFIDTQQMEIADKYVMS